MQKNTTICDACGAEDLPGGHVALNVGGDNAAVLRGRLPGSRNTLDLCDGCAGAFADWVQGRLAKAAAKPDPEKEKDGEKTPHKRASHGHAGKDD